MGVSRFDDVQAKTLRQSTLSLRQIADLIQSTEAPEKAQLPLLKLATFGDLRTGKGSLRSNDNLQSITGIEGDYDAGQVTPEEAVARLQAAGIAALVYTTASHKPDAPRWRVLAPLAEAADPAEREALCGRLDAALGGILGHESYTPSQSFYFGSIEGAPRPSVYLVDGKPIDRTAVSIPSEAADDSDELEPLTFDDWRPEPDWPRIKSALRAIKDASDRQTWLEIGMALHHATGGDPEGFRLWCVWSKRCPDKYSEKAQKAAWRSFGRQRGDKIGIGTLFHVAKAWGWESTEPAPPSRLSFLSPSDCEAAPPRGYVIKGLIAPGDVGCIFGAPGAGKSLLAPFLGYMVAQGSEAFGGRTKAGPVFYVAAEDPHGMRGRVKALKLAHGDARSFQLVEGVSDLLRDDSADLVALEAAVKAQRPSLIFIDTLAMAFPGLEENTAEGMGRVVAVCQRLATDGAAVVLVHHSTKAEDATPRGHSLLNGALFFALHVQRDEESGIIRGRLTKNRNGPCTLDLAFAIATEDGGVDEDGDTITLPHCRPVTAPQPEREKRLSPAAMAALDVLRSIGQPATEDDWRRACVDGRSVSGSEDEDSRKKAFRRAIADLTRSKRVIVEGAQCWEDDVFESIFDPIAPVDPDRHGQKPDMSGLVQHDKAAVADMSGTPPPIGGGPLSVLMSGCLSPELVALL